MCGELLVYECECLLWVKWVVDEEIVGLVECSMVKVICEIFVIYWEMFDDLELVE